MKKLLSTLCLITALIFCINANAQAQSKIQAGAGLVYGTSESSGLGINVNGYYTITKNIRAGIDFIYYIGTPEHVSFWSLNFNGHYHFDVSGGISPYALAGLNYSSVSVEVPTVNIPQGSFGGGSVSSSEIGLNIGGGIEYPLNFGAIFAEAKYVLSNANQFVIDAGIRFGF